MEEMKTPETTEMFPEQLYSYTTEGCYSSQRKKQHVYLIDREIILQSHTHNHCGDSILQVE